jgi:SAM-dependent methyltransferase
VSSVESDYYAFMGYDPEHTRSGLRHYLPWFPSGPVLELACGRGEFLDLLREAGVAASGVDLDDGMVRDARAAGHDIELADALTALRARPDASVQGVFSAHFVEHLDPPALQEVLRESARVLAPGGHLVAATPNAGCLSVLGHDFWVDPTHVRPYDPRLLAFLCSAAGLEVVETGANPRNHGGPPPATLPPQVRLDPDLRPQLVAALQGLPDTGTGPWHAFGHLVGVLEERLRATQAELAEVRQSYAQLLAQLYPPNEVYVVARAR